MPWDDEDEWPELPDDEEARERRRKAELESRAIRERALRWGYAILGVMLIVVIVLALTR